MGERGWQRNREGRRVRGEESRGQGDEDSQPIYVLLHRLCKVSLAVLSPGAPCKP